HAAAEVGRVGVELADALAGLAVEDAHVRAAAGSGPGHDVGVPVAVDVAHGHADTAAEAWCVGVEVEQHHPIGGPANDDLRGGAGEQCRPARGREAGPAAVVPGGRGAVGVGVVDRDADGVEGHVGDGPVRPGHDAGLVERPRLVPADAAAAGDAVAVVPGRFA